MIERLRFLFNELRPAVSNDLSIMCKLKLLSSQPRWKMITRKLIREHRKKRGQLEHSQTSDKSWIRPAVFDALTVSFLPVPKKSESADVEECKQENEGTNEEEPQLPVSPTPVDKKPPVKSPKVVL